MTSWKNSLADFISGGALTKARRNANVTLDVYSSEFELRQDIQRQFGNALTEISHLKVALHDAIRRPMGVVPASAEPFYDQHMADAAEKRRATHPEDTP